MMSLKRTSFLQRLFALLFRRSRAAFREPVSSLLGKEALRWVLLFVAVGLPLGWLSGLLQWRPTELNGLAMVRAGLVLFVLPCVLEELVFRVWLLPHPNENRSPRVRRLALAVSVVVFALWHVVNAWLFFPVARPLFWDLRFLLVAAWLGWMCGLLYLEGGSLWPPVLLHWVTVVAWKACLGGPVFFE